jgi:hypothetical protein
VEEIAFDPSHVRSLVRGLLPDYFHAMGCFPVQELTIIRACTGKVYRLHVRRWLGEGGWSRRMFEVSVSGRTTLSGLEEDNLRRILKTGGIVET